MSETHWEFGVEVEGHGFVNDCHRITLEAEWWTRDIDDANFLAQNMRDQFSRLRLDDLMVAVRVVKRQMTIERTDWCPLTGVPVSA